MISLDWENSCTSCVKFTRSSLPCPPVAAVFLNGVGKQCRVALSSPCRGRCRRQISHGNRELVQQPDRLFSMDGGAKECVCGGYASPAAQTERSFASSKPTKAFGLLCGGQNKRFRHLCLGPNEEKQLVLLPSLVSSIPLFRSTFR